MNKHNEHCHAQHGQYHGEEHRKVRRGQAVVALLDNANHQQAVETGRKKHAQR